MNQMKSYRNRKTRKFECLEDRRLLTQAPEFLTFGSKCGKHVVRNFQGEDAAYFAANRVPGCGIRLDYVGLFRTDGTADGTYALGQSLVETIKIDSLHAVHDKLYFDVITGGKVTFEIYESDGQPDNARRFANDVSFTVGQVDDYQIYACSDTCNGFQGGKLAAFNGESEIAISDTEAPIGSRLAWIDRAPIGDSLFLGGDHLWRISDPVEGFEQFQTLEGVISDIPGAPNRAEIIGTTSEDELYYWVTDSRSSDLWVTDGTTRGTKQVNGELLSDQRVEKVTATIWNDALLIDVSISGNQRQLITVNGNESTMLLQRRSSDPARPFYDWNGRTVLWSRTELLVTDGTPSGTSVIRGPVSIDNAFSSLFHTDENLYFESPWVRPGEVSNIFRSDGSEAQRIARNSKILTTAPNSVFYRTNEEIWMLLDGESEPVRFTERTGVAATDVHTSLKNGLVLFSAKDNGTDKFWVTDGTAEGTRTVATHPRMPDQGEETPADQLSKFFEFEDKVVFQASFFSELNALFSLNVPETDMPSAADINRDGVVSFADFVILSANFGKADSTAEHGDIDQDGIVGFGDFLLLSKDFGKQV